MASAPNTPKASQAADSPEGSSQRSPGLPKMEDMHFGLQFRDMEAAMEKWRDQNPQADTLRKLLVDLLADCRVLEFKLDRSSNLIQLM